MLHFADTQMEFAIDGYTARDLTKIAQGGLANDSRRDPNSHIAWVNQSSSSSLSDLSQVPILRLTKDISEGTEIVYRYSPNFQYSAAINQLPHLCWRVVRIGCLVRACVSGLGPVYFCFVHCA